MSAQNWLTYVNWQHTDTIDEKLKAMELIMQIMKQRCFITIGRDSYSNKNKKKNKDRV
jgi:hypothetical protein